MNPVSYSCWTIPTVPVNTTIGILAQAYFSANHTNLAAKRAAMFDLLLGVDGESARQVATMLLINDTNWANRLALIEHVVKDRWQNEDRLSKWFTLYHSK